MIVCPRCGKENEDGNLYCGRCGIEIATVSAPPQEAGESLFCYKHRKEPTRLRCGRCERPICTRCARIGPAGPRCPDCARVQTPVSFRGVAHDVLRTIRAPFRGGVYSWYLIILILVILGGSLRGCVRCAGPPRTSVERNLPLESPEPEQDADR